MTTKLTLKLSPETSKVLPWLIAAQKSGKPKDIAWAKREFDLAQQRARQRERWERESEEALRKTQEREEREHREFLEWEEKQRTQREQWTRLGIHFCREEDGNEYIAPTQSSQKGWRRMLSECTDLQDRNRYGQWGNLSDRSNEGKRNCGRKPRTPWFK